MLIFLFWQICLEKIPLKCFIKSNKDWYKAFKKINNGHLSLIRICHLFSFITIIGVKWRHIQELCIEWDSENRIWILWELDWGAGVLVCEIAQTLTGKASRTESIAPTSQRMPDGNGVSTSANTRGRSVGIWQKPEVGCLWEWNRDSRQGRHGRPQTFGTFGAKYIFIHTTGQTYMYTYIQRDTRDHTHGTHTCAVTAQTQDSLWFGSGPSAARRKPLTGFYDGGNVSETCCRDVLHLSQKRSRSWTQSGWIAWSRPSQLFFPLSLSQPTSSCKRS